MSHWSSNNLKNYYYVFIQPRKLGEYRKTEKKKKEGRNKVGRQARSFS